MGRFLMAGVLGVVLAAGTPSAFATYDNAAAARDAVLADGADLSQEDRASALPLLKAEAERSPRDAKTLLALVMVCEDSNDWDTGLPVARALAKLAPDVAEHQYRLGNALFQTIDDVSFLNKGARASAGRKAYETAITLDPSHVGARSGLFYFFMEAPGIAGGSKTKAREIATGMSEEPENASMGFQLLLQLAAKEEDWSTYHAIVPKAMDQMASDEERADLLLSSTYVTLFTLEDYEAGWELSQDYRRYAGEGRGGYTTNYFEGVALHGLDRFAEAKGKFDAVLAVQPEAKNTRFMLAECCENLGNKAEAAAHYAEFAERFEDDKRAKKARKKAKKLRK